MLQADPAEYGDEIRAAAALLIMLGRTYVWPIEQIDRHLELAIDQMTRLRAEVDQDPEFAAAVDEEIAILKSRRANQREGPVRSRPASWVNFWS
jgi:hypothetical protein